MLKTADFAAVAQHFGLPEELVDDVIFQKVGDFIDPASLVRTRLMCPSSF